jgi:hypothetical protein
MTLASLCFCRAKNLQQKLDFCRSAARGQGCKTISPTMAALAPYVEGGLTLTAQEISQLAEEHLFE